MDVILFLILGGTVAYLWLRLDKVESQLREWQEFVADAVRQGRFEARAISEGDAVADPPEPPTAIEAEPESLATPAARIEHEPATEPQHPAASDAPFVPAVDIAMAAVRAEERADDVGDHKPSRFSLSFDFEEIFGRLLPIWAGGIALAIAGFFLVRWSIEAGLLTPSVRVALGFLFGLGLVTGAELAYRFDKWIADERVRQALAGAGLATLYASFYLAGSVYGLIGATFAFVGLAAVTAAAIALSFRFGLPSAILGLVGGFAAPLLVGSDEANVPLLALYLALVTAGLTFTGRQQHRSWLALAALAGGLGWGVLLLLSGATGSTDILALGGYLVLLGAVLPAFSGTTDGPRWVRIGAAAIASIQLAGMVAQGEFSLLSWSLYLLIGAALAFFGWREPRMREASAIAAAIGVGMMALWVDPAVRDFAIVMAGLTAVFGIVPLALIWRDRARFMDFAQTAGFSLAASAVTWFHFGVTDVEPGVALAIFAFGLLPAMAAWLRWPARDARLSEAPLLAIGAAAIGLFAAGVIATPTWAVPLIGAAVAAGLLYLERGRLQVELVALAWLAALAGMFGLLTWDDAWREALALVEGGAKTDYLLSPLRWLAMTAIFAWLALRETIVFARRFAELLAAVSLYALAAQVLPMQALAWFAAVAAIALGYLYSARRSGQTVLYAIATIWSLPIVLPWLSRGIEALAGYPMFLANPGIFKDIALYALPVVAIAASILVRDSAGRAKWRAGVVAWGGVVAIAAAHLAFKQVFAIEDAQAFAALGVIERFIWQALLLAGAAAAWRLAGDRHWAVWLAASLLGAAMVHFAVFSLGWHNPLWSEQQVGNLPLANWLVPAYATGIAGLVAVRIWLASRFDELRPIADAALMVVISLFALSELRHAFAGTVLTASPVGQVEDVLRSVLGIVLAVGFLLWGSHRGERSWRIGSLVLMLAAVVKVFLFDAAGLEDLARIASFMALGFSLIGIGWFYNRQLRGAPAAPEIPAGG